jgi:anaerobic ribonucleoside-triphosphate reductase activating protein
MHYSGIKYNDISNGPGVRVSLFVSGCTNHCNGCFNTVTWDFNYGNLYTEKIEHEIIENLKLPRYTGITILGGEPFEIENQPTVNALVKHVRQELPDKSVWLYTGFTYDTDLAPGGKRYIPGVTEELLSNTDVLVDGKFDIDLKDISLVFRGSSNQRIIDLKSSSYDNIVPYFK